MVEICFGAAWGTPQPERVVLQVRSCKPIKGSLQLSMLKSVAELFSQSLLTQEVEVNKVGPRESGKAARANLHEGARRESEPRRRVLMLARRRRPHSDVRTGKWPALQPASDVLTGLEFAELSFRSQYMARSDIWRFKKLLHGSAIYAGQNLVRLAAQSCRLVMFSMLLP